MGQESNKNKIEPYPIVVAQYTARVGYHDQDVRDKNIKGLPKVGDVIILPKLKVSEPKSN